MKKVQKQLVFVDDVKRVHQERQAREQQEIEFKNQPGFTAFPYVHGEQVEKMRAEIRQKLRAEN